MVSIWLPNKNWASHEGTPGNPVVPGGAQGPKFLQTETQYQLECRQEAKMAARPFLPCVVGLLALRQWQPRLLSE